MGNRRCSLGAGAPCSFVKGPFAFLALYVALTYTYLNTSSILSQDLDKTLIGDYIGEREDFALRVMHSYVDCLDFVNLEFDDAIRKFLAGFRWAHHRSALAWGRWGWARVRWDDRGGRRFLTRQQGSMHAVVSEGRWSVHSLTSRSRSCLLLHMQAARRGAEDRSPDGEVC